jgi:hypothetical protein
MIHQILDENFGQRRYLWSLFLIISLMSSFCRDSECFMASDSVVQISEPPYSVTNIKKDWTAKVNAVLMDVFNDCFVQLLEICQMCVAVKEIIVKESKTILFWFYVCLFLKHQSWNCIVWPHTTVKTRKATMLQTKKEWYFCLCKLKVKCCWYN